MQKFKVGDKVRVIGRSITGQPQLGYEGIIRSANGTSFDLPYYWLDEESCGLEERQIELIVNNKINMNIKEKFVLALTKEPQKSFRKAGITNGDDLLTDDGQKIFLSFLLHNKFAEEFKKEVVDELLEEQEKETK